MRNLRVYIVSIAALVQLAASVPAMSAEDYYVWVDENGVTNYAERNPEGVNARFVSSTHTFGRRTIEEDQQDANTAAKESVTQNQNKPIDPDSLVEDDAAVLAAEVAEVKRKNCEIGKNNLAQLKAFRRIRVTDDKGENRILSEEEKNKKADQARQVIQDNCTG